MGQNQFHFTILYSESKHDIPPLASKANESGNKV